MTIDFTATQVVGSGALALVLWAAATVILAWGNPKRDLFDPPVFGGGALIASILTIGIHAMV